MFLSARAIAQAYLTRQFLLNLKQDGEALPDRPVVISPDGLFPSLYREVIRRAPHEFKIACLQDIRALFPADCNPFYAGFGNRDTDEISYSKVGIPKGKIFIINPKGEIIVNSLDMKSYTSLHKLVDEMLPPYISTEQEVFNSWNFWRVPIPDIEDELTKKSSSTGKKGADLAKKGADSKNSSILQLLDVIYFSRTRGSGGLHDLKVNLLKLMRFQSRGCRKTSMVRECKFF